MHPLFSFWEHFFVILNNNCVCSMNKLKLIEFLSFGTRGLILSNSSFILRMPFCFILMGSSVNCYAVPLLLLDLREQEVVDTAQAYDSSYYHVTDPFRLLSVHVYIMITYIIHQSLLIRSK
jgi:hypothetical protein